MGGGTAVPLTHPGRLRRALRALLADVTPLRRYPAYRRLWFGETVAAVGSQLTVVAVAVQVFALTGSSFAVGLLGLVAVGPLVAGGLLGGAVADAADRRRLAVTTSVGLALTSLVLVAQAAAGLDQVWLLYVVVAAQSALAAVNQPTRRAIVPRLLPAAQIPAATALSQIGWNVALATGPLLAGVAIAASGVGVAYGLDAASFLAALYGLARLPPMPPEGGGRRAGVASVLEGLRYLRGRRVVLMTFVVDLVAMVFGMPRALFPQLAVDQFGGGPRTVGVLYSAVAAGALVGALLGGWFGRVRRQGLAVLVAVAVWGAAIVGFGLARALAVGVLLLAVAGGADMVSAVFRTSILQTATPDAMRGRLQGVFIVVVTGGPRLGDLEAGAAAALVSPTFSVVSGGLACVGGVLLIAALVPAFACYDARQGDR
ncbi:MAG TPA: MFS transporter [Frankiaceae bacterium]|nr:MFS transporter [Frankiaceae bacterium]